ncbi:MAG: UDP-N-acetylmuramoyl-L-alanine--D-glutamate ligase [Defluviicoccus sp.]|nr:UDP-N-acetylmuramoyl-L-alanine--D-glutamate ligase [Defluviicoccus sp.]MDE0385389.1 UDP-N-acetylmuramoyl-L-alanine--D-glutamate ligase [Defluviicoccus sp.]
MLVPTRSNQTLAVFGLGSSGMAAVDALSASGATVLAWDDSPEPRHAAREAGIALSEPACWDWPGLDALVLSPGIRLTHPEPHPVVRSARRSHCPVIGDIELLGEAAPDARMVGVTGTNGKSTTTALLGHLLTEAGRQVAVGGNLGPPALSLPALGEGGIYVLECSSFQLDLIERMRFEVAILLNVSPDHLDRHGDMAGYVAAKRRIFRDRPGGGQVAIVGTDDDASRLLLAGLAARPGWTLVPVGVGRTVDGGVSVLGGTVFEDGEPVADLSGIDTLPGAHNHQNAAAAFAAARSLGLGHAEIARALATYPGLPHRQETVAIIDGVRYVNDSKATNGEASRHALVCYDAIYWIAGGRPKADGLAAVVPELHRVRRAYLIGEAEDAFAREIGGRAPVARCGDLARALAAAHRDAQRERPPGAAVLLSPACASFDQWPSFAARGDAFRQAVRALGGAAP